MQPSSQLELPVFAEWSVSSCAMNGEVINSLREYVETMHEPSRRYAYSKDCCIRWSTEYLDYGEACMDWLLRIFHVQPDHTYQTYNERYGNANKYDNFREEYRFRDRFDHDHHWIILLFPVGLRNRKRSISSFLFLLYSLHHCVY